MSINVFGAFVCGQMAAAGAKLWRWIRYINRLTRFTRQEAAKAMTCGSILPLFSPFLGKMSV